MKIYVDQILSGVQVSLSWNLSAAIVNRNVRKDLVKQI